MKRLVSVCVIFGTLFVATSVEAKSFKNCTALNKKYPYGVAKSAAAAAKQKTTPTVSAKIYKANIKMDRDKDGTVCEK